jgi:hypothetical protein
MDWNISAEYEVRGSAGHVSTAPRKLSTQAVAHRTDFEPLNKHYRSFSLTV